MKVLLIKPPNIGFYHEIVRFYPVGLGYLASCLIHDGHDVKIFDSLVYTQDNCVINRSDKLSSGQFQKINEHPLWSFLIRWGSSYNRILEYIRCFTPDIIGITAMHTPMYDTAYELVDIIKKFFPSIVVIMGGPHATIEFNHVLENTKTDYVMLGEGEPIINTLVKYIAGNKKPYGIPGIAFKDEGNIIVNQKQLWVENLDELYFPSANLLSLDKYDAVTIITSRGCPNNCKFCTIHPTMGYRFRPRTPNNVVEEIKMYVKKYGIKKFDIEDDNFLRDKKRAEAILDLIISENLNIELNFLNGLTVTNLDENIIQKMCLAGFNESFLGLETTSDKRRKELNKEFSSTDKVLLCQNTFRKYGKNIGASLIIGFPDQNINEMIDDIVNFIINGIEFGTANPCYPIPKSQLFYDCEQEGLIIDKDFTWFDEFNFPLETNQFTRKNICDLWLCSMAYDYYPKIFEILLIKHYISIFELSTLFKQYNYGELYTNNDGVIFKPNLEHTYSYIQKVTESNENDLLYIDVMNGKIISILLYCCCREKFTFEQVESILDYSTKDVFFLKSTDYGDYMIIDKFIKRLLQ